MVSVPPFSFDSTTVINRSPLILDATLTVKEAIAKIHETGADCGLITAAEKVVGIVTARDVMRFCVQGINPTGTKLGEAMTQPVFTLAESALTDLTVATEFFEQHHCHHLPLVDGQGKLTGVISNLDLLKTLELAENEARLQKLSRTIPGILSVCRQFPDGTMALTYVGEKSKDFLEVDPELLIRDIENLFKLVHPDDLENYQAAITRSFSTMTPFFHEMRLITPSGKVKWLQSLAQPDKAPNGDIDWFTVSFDITERKQVERELEFAEKNLKEAQRLAQIGSWEVDQTTGKIQWSEEVFRILGLEPNAIEASYETFLEFLPPEDQLTLTEAYTQLLNSHHPNCPQGNPFYDLVLRLNAADGQIKYVRERCETIFSVDGEPLFSRGTMQDITEVHRAQVLLRKLVEGTASVTGENFFVELVRHLAETLEVGYAIVGVKEGPNLQTLGYFAKGDMIANCNYLQKETPCEQTLLKGQFFCGGRVQEIFPEDHDLKVINAQTYVGVAMFDEDGEAIGHLCILDDRPWSEQKGKNALDIMRIFSARASAELQRIQALEQLQKFNQDLESKVEERNHQLLQISRLQNAILNSTEYAIISTDIKGIIQTFNAGAEKLLGYQAEEVIGKMSPLMFVDRQETEAKAAALSEKLGYPVEISFEVLVSPLEHDQTWEEESTHIRKDGSSLPMQMSITPLQDDRQKIIGYLGIGQDITQKKEADRQRREVEEQLRQTNQQLTRVTKLKDEFLANMSHELRTPLNAILGNGEILQEEIFGEINEKQLKALKIIEKSGNHLLSLINDILDVSKIESGQIELAYSAVAIAPLCHSSLTFIKQQASKKQIHLEISIPPDLTDISADERRLRQVLINLLNNAVKFTPQGGRISLTVSTFTPENGQPHLQLAIADTGIGISEENISKLFKPFVQIDSALNRQYDGTGLGLALVKQIVELHGGEVAVSSELGVGSCFTVQLPYASPKT